MRSRGTGQSLVLSGVDSGRYRSVATRTTNFCSIGHNICACLFGTFSRKSGTMNLVECYSCSPATDGLSRNAISAFREYLGSCPPNTRHLVPSQSFEFLPAIVRTFDLVLTALFFDTIVP